MSGMYGTVKPADINIGKDVEVFYHYRPSFNSDDSDFKNFKELDAESVLQPCSAGDDNTLISGLFNLKLDLKNFSRRGIYTIYIRPKEIEVTISNIGVLAAFPDVRGVVFEKNDTNLSDFGGANSLVGYRIEYMNSDGKKNGDFKIITSSNPSECISYALNNSSDKGIKYRYTMSGNQIFCTVTPSLAPTFKPNDLPLIGNSGQKVKLVNTKFNPVMLELEMVEHDNETIAYMLEGDQLVDKDKALITTFNKNGEIYHQSEYGAYKDEYGTPLYEFRKKRDNIDFNQSLDNLE
jgi:hypothetical protein